MSRIPKKKGANKRPEQGTPQPEAQCVRVVREKVAFEIASYLADVLDIEASTQHRTVISPTGEEFHFHIVRAICTNEEMEKAGAEGFMACVNFDRQLIEAGLLPEWKNGPNVIPVKDYL